MTTQKRDSIRVILVLTTCWVTLSATTRAKEADPAVTTIEVTVDRGQDFGQSFGSLFEGTSKDGTLVVGAGFQNLYNTRYRADRHAVQFFIRPAGERKLTTEPLPRPNNLCGTYLHGRDGTVHSTYGGLKAWNEKTSEWQDVASRGGTQEAMRVGARLLEFGESEVKYDGRVILDAPAMGSYQLFFYANGHLCFYHVHRRDQPYHPYVNDEDGFSKLVACPWAPGRDVDLTKAVSLTLPVVGETTFAWGQLGNQIVTGSNIGGFYVFENGAWRMLLEPNLNVSYQLYSTMAYHDRLLMGQYPTGRIFEYDGKQIKDLPGWPPVLQGVSSSAREAQTTVIYGGDVFVGVWPWGELWRYNPDAAKWTFMRRMFPHPEISDKVTHPYDGLNAPGEVGNQWGQRVTSLVTSGSRLFISTSAKWPCEWDADKYPFLAPERWKSYGTVYQAEMPGHLSGPTKWTDGPTKIEFTIRGTLVTIRQDGREIARTELSGSLVELLGDSPDFLAPKWGQGIYGRFHGKSVAGEMRN